ncbi:MAG: hypothetical protein HQM13_10585 [SAR324 cluster bacterium]|nr:hypothetical protein [SAR324 cluster bacterium]
MLRFFFDIDGVLLDFETSYIRTLKDYFQLDIPDGYRTEDWGYSDMLSAEQFQEGWDYFLNSEHFTQLSPLIPSALFNGVFGAYPVHFITNIPPQYLEKRKQNLHNAGFQWDSLHCGGFMSYDDKPPVLKADIIHQLVKEQEILLFVDDHPDNCVNVLEKFSQAKVWLMSRPFNREFTHSRISRANDWDHIIAFSRKLIASVENKH